MDHQNVDPVLINNPIYYPVISFNNFPDFVFLKFFDYFACPNMILQYLCTLEYLFYLPFCITF